MFLVIKLIGMAYLLTWVDCPPVLVYTSLLLMALIGMGLLTTTNEDTP